MPSMLPLCIFSCFVTYSWLAAILLLIAGAANRLVRGVLRWRGREEALRAWPSANWLTACAIWIVIATYLIGVGYYPQWCGG